MRHLDQFDLFDQLDQMDQLSLLLRWLQLNLLVQ